MEKNKMIIIKITKTTESEDPEDREQCEHSIKLSNWAGEELTCDVSCDKLLLMFRQLLLGMGYHNQSIVRCMAEVIEEYDEKGEIEIEYKEDLDE
jgi:hypothetical protein